MYAAIRRYRAPDADEALRRADSFYAGAVARQVGFCDYQIVRTGPEEAITFLLFETQDECDRNRAFTSEFQEVGLAGLDVRLLDEWRGEVAVSCASEHVLGRMRLDDRTPQTA